MCEMENIAWTPNCFVPKHTNRVIFSPFFFSHRTIYHSSSMFQFVFWEIMKGNNSHPNKKTKFWSEWLLPGGINRWGKKKTTKKQRVKQKEMVKARVPLLQLTANPPRPGSIWKDGGARCQDVGSSSEAAAAAEAFCCYTKPDSQPCCVCSSV